MHYVYIVKCADGTLYAGSTNDVEKRVHEHNATKSGARYTKARRPVALVYTERYRTRSKALKREVEIKKWSRKEKLHAIRCMV